MSEPTVFDHARALAALDPERLNVTTSANPGRWTAIEAMIAVDETGALWIVDHTSAEPLDRALWRAFHVDPDDHVLGRLRITIEAP